MYSVIENKQSRRGSSTIARVTQAGKGKTIENRNHSEYWINLKLEQDKTSRILID